ncbi:M28 family peptidase [Jiulongibacter sp. NS-SX5]|uniref:M28 family peptidase n=1 Tax=Jiulongibacter sp. NS-SX5 TaxID=3463854 RepID=UPI00405A3814
MRASIKISAILLSIIFLTNCKSGSEENKTESSKTAGVVLVPSPAFDATGAYDKVQKQVDFGPRVPNSAAHTACGDWIVNQLKDSGLEVTEQTFQAFSFKGKTLNARNIIASYNPQATKRILLGAHYDTRPVADQDEERTEQPIPGANDGGSGVAVLLQIAEEIAAAEKKPNVGIDYIFFDVEDGGTPDSFEGNALNDFGGYCMGSEYWSKNPHKENYSAFYGVLLDMVGAKGATFLKDKASMQVAPSVVNKIWGIASQKGYSSFFLPQNGGDIMDDHIPVIINAKIPMIDIIDQKTGNQTFFDHWHTHDDNMESIDPSTLKAVGETLLQTLYQEEGVI